MSLDNYTGCKVKMIVSERCVDFEDMVNKFLELAYRNNYIIYDIKYQHSMSYYRPTTYSAMVLYSTQ